MTFAPALARLTEKAATGTAPTVFPIYDQKSGLKLDKEPWLLPQNAFTRLTNFYVWRGRVYKRGGYRLMCELGTASTQTFAGTATDTLITGTITNHPLIGASGSYVVEFSDGDAPPQLVQDKPDDVDPFPTNPAIRNLYNAADLNTVIGLLNLTTGQFFFTLAAPAANDIEVTFRYNRMLPIVGIQSYKSLDGNEHLVICDTRRVFLYDPSSELAEDIIGSDLFTGDEADLFTFAALDDELYLSNGIDPVQVYDGSTGTVAEADTDFDSGSAGNDLDSAKIVLAHRRRILYFNTIENGDEAPGRVRLTNAEAPHVMSAGDASDATTGEPIIAAVVQNEDDILVFFESQTKVLHYDGDDFRFPYVWRDGSQVYGAVGRRAAVAFEDAVFARSRSAVIAASGVRAAPIDGDVPDITKNWSAEAGVYSFGLVVPELRQTMISYAELGKTYPEALLVFNTENGSVSIYDDMPFHVYARYAQQTAINLDDIDEVLDTIATPLNELGAAGIGTPIVLGGTRDSRVFVLFTGSDDDGAEISAESRSARLMPYPMRTARLHHIGIIADALTGAKLTLGIFKDFEDSAFSIQEVSLTPDVVGATKVHRTISVNQEARFFQIEVISDDTNPTGWDALLPHFSPAGRWRNF